MVGLVDGGDLGTWQIVKPQAGTNLCTNSSWEVGTTGWTTTTATITRTAGAGVFGAYGGRLLASAQNGKIAFTAAAVASGSSNALSMWVKADSASVSLKGTIGATNESQAHPGDGEWHRLSVSFTAPSATTPVLEIIDGRSSAWTAVDTDGAQIETGVTAPTVYMDGDQDGCTWSGTAHGSTSTRDGRDPRGGALVSLASLGWTEKTWGGVGTPEVETISQELALGDGQLYQNQRAKERVITLSALASVANLAALHAARRSLLDAMNPNSRTGRGPVRLRYAGAATPKLIDVVNESGFGFDKPFHQRAEMAELRFLAPDPVWKRETEVSASLTTSQSITGLGHIIQRDAAGAWSSLSGGHSGNNTPVYGAERLFDGRLVVGGAFANMGGVAAADFLAVWDGTSWAQFSGVTPSSTIRDVLLSANGDLYVCGDFDNLDGIANADRVARWNAATDDWSALGTGASGGNGYQMVVDPVTNDLYLFGSFTSIGGVATNGVGRWNGSAWSDYSAAGTFTLGTTRPSATIGPDGSLLAVNGNNIQRRPSGGAWASWATVTGGGATVQAIISKNGLLYAFGDFTAIGGVSAVDAAVWNGSAWAPLGSGLVGSGVMAAAADAAGRIYVGGQNISSAGGVTLLDSLAVWDGSVWSLPPLNPPDTSSHSTDQYSVMILRDETLLVWWQHATQTFGTTATADAITTVTNAGSAIGYPVIEWSGAGWPYQIENLTTGQVIRFSASYSLASGEKATLDLRPGRKTFATPLRNLLPTIQQGSDLSTFGLAPGDNQIAVYGSGGTATIRWTPREWSVD